MAASKIAKVQDFRGLIAAPFTAFKSNGEVNPDIIPSYVDFLVSQGVKGVFVHGTTGEGVSLSVQERKQLAEVWVKASKNKLELVIIQVGGANCLLDVKELAAHAEKIGACAIATHPPLYFRPTTDDHLVAYLKEIASAAPNLPLMLYHIPSFSYVDINLGDFLPKARDAVPTFCGAKFTSLDVRDLIKCHSNPGPPLKVLSGFDEVLLPCMSTGVTAAVGATYNFMAPLSMRIMNAFEKGDIKAAQQHQQKVANIVETITKYSPSMSALKSTMNILGPIHFGPPRLPLVPLSPEDEEKLKKDLQRLNAKDWSRV